MDKKILLSIKSLCFSGKIIPFPAIARITVKLYYTNMATNKKKKQPHLGMMFWIAAILLVLVFFLTQKDVIIPLFGKFRTELSENSEKERQEKEVQKQKELEELLKTPELPAGEDGSLEKEIQPEKKDTLTIIEPVKEIKPENSQPEKTTEKKDEPAKQEKDSSGTEKTETVKEPEKTTEKKDEPAKQEKNEDTKPQVQAQETRDAVLYFISVDNSGTLVREKIIRQVKKTDSPLTIAINSLLTGPTSVENQKGIISLIPSGTKLLSATVKNGTAVLNFNESFQFNTKGIEGCRGQLMQIVYTATEFSTVDNVQFLIEGQRKEFLGTEGIRIGYPLSRSSFN